MSTTTTTNDNILEPTVRALGQLSPSSQQAVIALVGQLGFTVAGGVAAGLAAGWALDRWVGTRAAFKIAGLLVGLAGGGLAAYRLLTGFMRGDGD